MTRKVQEKQTPAKETAIVVEEKEQIAVYQQQQQSIEAIITKAITEGVPVETMERVLAMRTQLKKEYAKERFDRDMATFQSECPIIKKTKTARDEGKKVDLYKYAPLDAIVEQVGSLIGNNGFSYSFKTKNEPDRIAVTCTAKHKDGHAEESTMNTSLVTKTNIMSGPQQIAATVTFNKRYAFMNAFGITVGGEDDEDELRGKEEVDSFLSTEILRQLIKDAKLKEGLLAGKFNASTIDDLGMNERAILKKSLLQKLGPDYIPVIMEQ